MVDYDFPQATRALTRQARRMGQGDAVRAAHTPATMDTVASRKTALVWEPKNVGTHAGFQAEVDGPDGGWNEYYVWEVPETYVLNPDASWAKTYEAGWWATATAFAPFDLGSELDELGPFATREQAEDEVMRRFPVGGSVVQSSRKTAAFDGYEIKRPNQGDWQDTGSTTWQGALEAAKGLIDASAPSTIVLVRNLFNDSVTVVELSPWAGGSVEQVASYEQFYGRPPASRREATRYTVTEVTGYTGEGDGMEAIVRTHLLSRDELADLFGDERQADSLIENGRLGEHDEWMIQSTSARREATLFIPGMKVWWQQASGTTGSGIVTVSPWAAGDDRQDLIDQEGYVPVALIPGGSIVPRNPRFLRVGEPHQSSRRTATHSLDWHAAPDQWWGASVDGIQIIVQPRAGSYEYVVEGPGASLSGTSPTLADAKADAEATAYDEFL